MKVYKLNEEQIKRIKVADNDEVAFLPSYSDQIQSAYIAELNLLEPIFSNHKSIIDEFIDELEIADIDIFKAF